MSILFAIGSENERKIETVQDVLRSFRIAGIVQGYKASSGVPDTPYDKQTYEGANNRAEDCRRNAAKADFYIGLESGLVERYGHMFEEAWCVVIDAAKQKKYFGYSSGLKLPDYVLGEMKRLKKEHCDVMTILEEKHGKLPNDTWGNYSAGMITRKNSLQEAVRNCLIQIFASEESFYKKVNA